MIIMIRITIGIIMILIGISGLVLPLIPGVIFIFLGILVLSVDLPIIGRMLDKIEQRYPQHAEKLKKLRALLKKSNN